MTAFYIKEDAAVLDYAIDWQNELNGESIVPGASSWHVFPPFDNLQNPSGLRTYPGSEATQGSVTSAAFFSGITGTVYEVTNRVALASGRVLSRSISIRIGRASAI